jgi:glycosyltransferase involved in cell wall biosynthesis
MSVDARPYLSLAILAYNEDRTIEKAARLCSEVLQASGKTYELVLVDDGSKDQTREIMGSLAADLPCCRTIFHPRNLQIGAGIRTCYFGTKGEWATWFPADLQADPNEIPRLLTFLGGCDVLLTYRDPAKRHGGWFRRAVSFTDRALVRLLFGLWLRDLHWIRFFRREVLDRMKLSCRSPLVDTEMILQAQRQGARIRQIPLEERPREFGEASGGSPSHLWHATRDLIALRLRGIELAPEGRAGTLPAHEDPGWLEDDRPAI